VLRNGGGAHHVQSNWLKANGMEDGSKRQGGVEGGWEKTQGKISKTGGKPRKKGEQKFHGKKKGKESWGHYHF